MIIWNGKGIFVPLAFIVGICTEYLIGQHLNWSMKITVLVGMGVAAALIQLVATFLVSNKVKYVTDDETGERYEIKDRSSFFFIPVKYWTFIILAFGIFSAFTTN